MKKNNVSLKTTDTTQKLFIKILPYLLLAIISIFPLIAFFHSGLPVTHDGKDHVARIANFYLNLQQGNLVPRWAPNLNWGYGHPILMFLYPFPSYFASLFHFFGLSLTDSVKAVFIVAYIVSGFTMYIWAGKILNRYAGFFAAILYLFAPYRFVDMHVRGAYGEHVAFIFPPLVLYFLYKLSKKCDAFTMTLGALTLAGLLLSHNAISLMFLPIFVLYGVYLLFQREKKREFFIYSTGLFLFGFFISAFFIIPALLEGKYTLRDIVTSADYASRFVPFTDFIYSQWSFGGTNSLSKQIGIIQWIVSLITIGIGWIWYRKKNTFWQIAFGNSVVFIVSLFIMMSPSKFIWDHIKILENFQFPWRFLTVTVFSTALSGGLFLYSLPAKKQLLITIILSVLAVAVTIPYWGVNGYFYKPDSFYSGIYEGTTDTGESAPIWSVRFMEKKPKAHIEIIDGKGTVIEMERTPTRHIYKINAQDRVRIRENTLYFPGWEVTIDGEKVQPEFQDPKNRGLITFYAEKGIHALHIVFKETKIRLMSDYISIFALVTLGIFCIMKLRFVWKHSR